MRVPVARSLQEPADLDHPTITSAGGLDAYVPARRLGARQTILIDLEP